MNRKQLNNERPAEEIKEELGNKIKETISNKVQQKVVTTIFTDKETKIERATNKLEKKEDRTFLNKTASETELKILKESPGRNKILTGGESLKTNTMKTTEQINSSNLKLDNSKNSEKLNPLKPQHLEPLKSTNIDTIKNDDSSPIRNSADTKINEKRIFKEDKRDSKLTSKMDKLDIKQDTKNSKLDKLNTKSDLLNEKIVGKKEDLLDKKKTPFSSSQRGRRTTGAKVLTAPINTSSSVGGSYKKRIVNRDIQESDDQGLKFANQVVSKSSNVLRKQTVKTFNNKLGFDRKANNLLNVQKKEVKVRKQTLKTNKQQVKINRKKLRNQRALNKGSVGSRIENMKMAITNFIKSLGNGGSIMQNAFNSKFMLAGGGALIVLLSIGMIALPIGVGVMGGLGGAGDTAIIYEYGDVALSIDLESEHYHSLNPYTRAGYRGQCTWYVWGRVHELYNKRLPAGMGNGQDWADSVKDDDRFTVGSEPRTHSIMVLGGNDYGHVAFVESYDPDEEVMIVSEGNIGNPMSGTEVMVDYAKEHYAELFTLTNTMSGKETSRYGMTILGYIYLEDFVDMGVGE